MRQAPFFIGVALTSVLAGVGAAADHRLALVLLIGSVILIALVTNAQHSAVLLLILAMLVVRPGVEGAQYNIVGVVLAVGAGVLASFRDTNHRGHDAASKASRSLLLWSSILWLWTVVLSARASAPLTQNLKGAAGVVLVLAAALVVLRDHERQRLVLKGIIGITLVLCASWLISAGVWVLGGPSAGSLGDLPSNAAGVGPAGSVYFPFTLVNGLAEISGVRFGRFIAFLREPGLAQGVIAWAYFMLPKIGWNTRTKRTLLIAGLIGTLSTAGLGVFAITWVLRRYILQPRPGELLTFRRFLGLLSIPVAAWLIIAAPTVGLQAKDKFNPASVSDRGNATLNGLHSLINHPLGIAPSALTGSNVAINLIAAVTLIGAPGLIFGLIAYFRPLALADPRVPAVIAALPLILTSIASQPVLDAPLWWVLLALAVGVARRPGPGAGKSDDAHRAGVGRAARVH